MRARLIAAIALALGGCATTPARIPYTATEAMSAAALPKRLVRFWSEGDDAKYAQWSTDLLADRQRSGLERPKTLLALSGGSDKGAFGAGLLNGWSRRGGRPSFDLVTGVSTGALIAPFAFLGEDEDATLRSIYTGIGPKDVYKQRVLSGLFGGSSLLDSKPLARLIARYANAPLIDRIAAEHRKGRRLLVMTTNLDAERAVIWDMGAIAASDAPDRVLLFQKVLLASASIPGAFPPVLIDVTAGRRPIQELHVDGGASAGFFVLPGSILSQAQTTPGGGDNAIYIIYNGRYEPEFKIVRLKAFSVISRSLSTLLTSLDHTNVDRLRAIAVEKHIAFSFCSLENDVTSDKARLFDTTHMRVLFRQGEEAANAGGCLGSSQWNDRLRQVRTP